MLRNHKENLCFFASGNLGGTQAIWAATPRTTLGHPDTLGTPWEPLGTPTVPHLALELLGSFQAGPRWSFNDAVPH